MTLFSMRLRALLVALFAPFAGGPVIIAMYLHQQHSCVHVCKNARHGWAKTWDHPKAAIWLLNRDEAAVRAHAAGISWCQHRWDQALPTLSLLGGSFPEYYVFATTVVIMAAFSLLGYVELEGLIVAAASGSCWSTKRTLVLMRWLWRVSNIMLCGSGLVSVGYHLQAHTCFAVLFFISYLAHFWTLWVMQLMAAHRRIGRVRMPFALLALLRQAQGWSAVKVAVAMGYFIVLFAAAIELPRLHAQHPLLVLQVGLPILEWAISALNVASFGTLLGEHISTLKKLELAK